MIFSIKIIFTSLKDYEVHNKKNKTIHFTTLRRDIVDRNGTLISRNVKSFHAAVNPRLIKNKENFLLNVSLTFQNFNRENKKRFKKR